MVYVALIVENTVGGENRISLCTHTHTHIPIHTMRRIFCIAHKKSVQQTNLFLHEFERS